MIHAEICWDHDTDDGKTADDELLLLPLLIPKASRRGGGRRSLLMVVMTPKVPNMYTIAKIVVVTFVIITTRGNVMGQMAWKTAMNETIMVGQWKKHIHTHAGAHNIRMMIHNVSFFSRLYENQFISIHISINHHRLKVPEHFLFGLFGSLGSITKKKVTM